MQLDISMCTVWHCFEFNVVFSPIGVLCSTNLAFEFCLFDNLSFLRHCCKAKYFNVLRLYLPVIFYVVGSFVSCLQSAVSLSSSIVAMDSGSSKITPKLFLPESKTYGRRAISLSELDTGVSRDAERGKAKKTFSAQGANNFPSLSEVG